MENNQDNRRRKTDRPAVEVPSNGQGGVGIRATLNNLGVANSRIGYDEGSGSVTLDGRFFMKPETMDDARGISYAGEDAIRRQYAQYTTRYTNDPAVKVSDYYTGLAGQYGLTADNLGYSDGTVTIGGNPVDYYYTDQNGKAWAAESAVQNAAQNYLSSTGLRTPNELLTAYTRQYLNPVRNLLSQLADQKPFTYNPQEDPVYTAYAQVYQTEGNRASRDALASYAAGTGGYVNSAAVTAGALAEQYYANLLAAQVPALAEQAYQRYSDQYSRTLSLTDSMLDLYKSAYESAVSANTQTMENINAAAASNRERDRSEREARRQETEDAQADLMFGLEYRIGNQKYYDMTRDAEWKEILNTQKKEAGDLDNAQKGYEVQMSREEAALYPQLLAAQLSGEQADAEYRRAMTAKIRAMLGM